MSKAELIATTSDGGENTDYILSRLPSWMPTDETKGNYKLIGAVGAAIDHLDGDLTDLDNATTVQDATTVDQLNQLAKLVDLPPQEGEARDRYRSRVIAEFQTMTTEGTAADVIENAATLLGVAPSDIKYTKLNESGTISLGVPGNALENEEISNNEFVEIISKHSAAGYRIEATVRGTFTYMSPSDYTNDQHDPDRGYAGLTTDGEPTETGGTYAGLLE